MTQQNLEKDMQENKKKVGILTSFYEFSSSYSLCSVVENQLTALVKNGYNTVLFVHDNFKDDSKVPKGVEIRKIVPRFTLIDYSSFQEPTEQLQEEAKTAYKAFKEHSQDIDVMIEHDLIFQGWFLPYCLAIHKLAQESKIKWFHWIHSAPSGKQDVKYPHNMRFTLPENSKLVYLNNFHLVKAAETYNIFPKDVRVVYNPLDPRLFWNLHPLTHSLIEKYGLLDADLIQVYPLSTPRMVSGKGLHTLIEIMGQLKKLNRSVRLVVCNAHANDKREKQLIAETQSFASQNGLSANEVIFTSLEDEKYELGVPREVVSQLFQLSNLFIFPSQSENCSLILLEAMLSKCLLVLNENVGAMREFGKENALYFKFGSNYDTVNYDDKQSYMKDVAKIILSEFENNKVLKASRDIRQNYNYETIFTKQILPILHEL
ncbi:MAG TPA: glycosyltransferase [bacterium]|nr:glycosyltransferase [bacterium]